MTRRPSSAISARDPSGASESSLYDLLGELVGTARSSGETNITKSPETVDEAGGDFDETVLYG